MAEIDPLVLSYSHLAEFPRAKDALIILKKVASLVKPIMRARGWKVHQLTEFYPPEPNLLGLNVNRGQKICLRLRYPGDRNQFLPIEQVTDTMLHELSHNVHGPHDAKFHALWNQLRDEHEALVMKGYTGEGFLSEGHRLGGGRIPMHEARRVARAAAEKRRTLSAGSGQRLGGMGPRSGADIRRVIANAVDRRNKTLQGCANDNHNEDELFEIAETATRNGFKTQAEEDAANEAAIAQALWELVQEDEKAKYGNAYVPPTAGNPIGNRGPAVGAAQPGPRSTHHSQETPQWPPYQSTSKQARTGRPAVAASFPISWSCKVCTLENPSNYLCCDACGTKRGDGPGEEIEAKPTKRPRTVTVDLTSSSPPDSAPIVPPAAKSGSNPRQPPTGVRSSTARTWACSFCGRNRPWEFWSCDLCGKIKDSS
ncbi:WLM domain-containing protein [Xylariales sp. PMI_506]|nr:WLM domain-containing protein [Xylariales sp. PMI_506]